MLCWQIFSGRIHSVHCVILLVLVGLEVIGFSYGNSHEYMTLLNYNPSKAGTEGLGFICHIPTIDYAGDSLSYGRSYESVTEMQFTLINGNVDYKTPANTADEAGVYYCKLEEDGTITIVQTTKINTDAIITPSYNKSSLTTNIGDAITIRFDVNGDVTRPFVWRKDGIKIADSVDENSMTFNAVTVEDAGLYEMHGTDQRNEFKHSFINLIVRGCPRHKWGPPECLSDCEFCYNGGVCDDKTGECICAPGFKGKTCQTMCGGNRYGWDCALRCTYLSDPASQCRRYQFCLPYPYGCNCVTGYKGADCLTECLPDTFGAGCTEVCHCHNSSDVCDRYTGECSGPCHPRWRGSNCQECEDNYFGENCEIKCPESCHNCTRINGVCITCSDGWIEPECKTGIVEVFFTPANDGQMTDVYCRVKRGNTSVIDAIIQIESGGVTQEDTHIGSIDGNDGITSYRFPVISNTSTTYYCVIQQNDSLAKIELENITIYRLPSYSGKIDVIDVGTSNIEVSWEEWNNETDTGDGPIIGYIIHYKETYKRDSNWLETKLIGTVSGMIDKLQWETNYTIAVSAVREGKGGQGPIGTTRTLTKTLCGEPDPVKDVTLTAFTTNELEKNIVVTWSDIEATVDVLKCSNLTYFVYTVYLITNDETKQLYRGRKTSFQFQYNTDYDGNVIAVTVSNRDNEGRPSELSVYGLKGSSSSGVIGGAIGGVLCLCIVLGLIYILIIRKMRAGSAVPHKETLTKMEMVSSKKYYEGYSISERIPDEEATYDTISQKESRISDEDETYEAIVPIETMNFSRRFDVLDFVRYVAKSKIHHLQQDFESLPKVQLYPWDCALQKCNLAKNRSENIIPYDKHRVVLDSYDGSDYYNASYIDGYIEKKHYIASQGPNKATLNEFWRMIWQKEISIIVMLTDVIDEEKKNRKAYWPENIETYNGITVSFQNEEVNDEYCIRTFAMWLKSNDVSRRIVKQYHYLSWSDSGIPKSTSNFLVFIAEIRSVRFDSGSEMHLLVHCNTGGGQTGTYIVIDAMLDMMKAEQSLDVLSYVKDVEEHRISMVQTVEQYIFIHDALVEFYLNDTVQISISNFENQLQYLKQLNPASRKPFIEEEFELLNSITQTFDPKLEKVDKARVQLMSGKKYESASFLDGYKTHCRFIVTGAPLLDTIDDFWQVIYEWKVSTIVMLNHLDSSAATYLQPCAIYWPETLDGVIKSRSLRIQLKSQENREEVVIRNFSIKSGAKAGQKESTLKQYQVLNWPPEQDIPVRLETLLDIYEMVQSDSVAKNPVIVHCINGIGRTGVYCTVTEVLDRMR